jgi:hypothetical protein
VWPVIQSGLAYGLSTVSLFLIIASIVFMVVQPAGSCLCWATPFSDAPSCMGARRAAAHLLRPCPPAGLRAG